MQICIERHTPLWKFFLMFQNEIAINYFNWCHCLDWHSFQLIRAFFFWFELLTTQKGKTGINSNFIFKKTSVKITKNGGIAKIRIQFWFIVSGLWLMQIRFVRNFVFLNVCHCWSLWEIGNSNKSTIVPRMDVVRDIHVTI